MSDIFLSYAREDRERVAPLAEALLKQGWSVFWDVAIPPGQTWRQVIGVELEQARCVVVAWSAVSVHRHWVLEEAEDGLGRNILVPLLLDNIRPPLGFRSIQAADFKAWTGDADAGPFRQLLDAIRLKIGPPVVQAGAAPPVPNVAPDPPSPQTPAPLIELPPVLRHRLRDGSLGPELVLIPAGEFRMGDIDGLGYDNEKPVHTVRIARPFYLGRYALTFDDYDRFARDQKLALPSDQGWGRGNRPVIHITWHDAVAYCRWLAEQTGQPYRLPSEAEWEYAARAGTETAYWWGDEPGQNRANFDGSGSPWSNKQTAPVGSFPPNPWGLHDTAGNVWEWVQDGWHNSYAGAPADGSAWEDGGSARVLRGGSWFSNGRHVRSANRSRLTPDYRLRYTGCRLALGPTGR